MFLLECAIALAQFSVDYHSTILVLDDGLHGLDQEWHQRYLPDSMRRITVFKQS